ncbi:MAG: N,N-dimethylformamidase beta subunit family domain-containing protein [Bryobacteraceae bacterium]
MAISRRRLLQLSAASALPRRGDVKPFDTRTAEENRRPGTVEWQLRHYRYDNETNLRSPQLEGFVSDTSAYPGETLEFPVSTNPARKYTIDIYRTGCYDGAGGRHMVRLGPFAGEPQPVPMMGMERVRECAWKSQARLAIPADWPSGVYLGKLSLVDDPIESYVIFIVKSRRPADFLFQCSDLTWNAYNKWPGHDSLYDDGLPHPTNGHYYTGPNVRTSFDRPYCRYGQVHEVALSLGSGEYLLWEFPLAFWMEQRGYEVTYCSNLDVHRDPAVLDRCKVFLSVGHDEYWTRRMYDNVMAARDRGVSLAFLSGNAICGEVVLYESTVTGKPFRTMARLRQFSDEHLLMGLRSFGPGYGDWVVTKADHWIFEGSGMRNGDYIPGLVGWEYHGVPAALPGLEVVAAGPLAPFSRHSPEDGKFAAVVFPGKKSNWVFNAGTIWWSEGLGNPPGHAPAASRLGRTFGVDRRVQRITENFFNRCLRDSALKF